jgi:phospholipid/cholesterol/gamma-HCH transport system ATP-binding protein
MIKLVDVYKSFNGHEVLKGVNLEIADGKTTAIIGRSGGGKSVLLKHIIGLLRPDKGQVLVDSTDISRLNNRDLNKIRKRFGILFQGGALFDSLTVYDNIAFPLREKTRLKENEIRKMVDEKLEQLGLLGMGYKYPAEISGGMKKRVGLARALIMDPEIMLFDEPTTGLDPIMKNAIYNLISKMHKKFGFTAVVVSHEIPDIFGIAHYVAMLNNGVIVESGRSTDIQKSTNPVVREFVSEGVFMPNFEIREEINEEIQY